MTRPPTAQERQRLRTNVNLWRALIPLLLLVGVGVALGWPRGDVGDGVHVVDTAGPIAAARQQAGFPVLTPTGLTPTWRPTSTTFTAPVGSAPSSLRIGYVSPTRKYAEFVESSDAPDAVSGLYGPLTAEDNTLINGMSWQRYQTGRGRELLRRVVGRVTVVVTGSASDPELSQLAGSLH